MSTELIDKYLEYLLVTYEAYGIPSSDRYNSEKKSKINER